MNVAEAIRSVRDDYVEQLGAFVAQEQRASSVAARDCRLAMPQSTLFARAYVPDIFVPGPPERMTDFVPRARDGKLPEFTFRTPNVTVEFEDLWWDDLRLDHDGEFTGPLISAWFNRWFPAAQPQPARSAGAEGYIHSACVDERWITADLGSADAKSLFELLNVAQKCGATHVRVSTTRARTAL